MKNKFLFILLLPFLFYSCEKSSLDPIAMHEPKEWITAKVAVVLPLSGEDNDKMRYERIFKMFEERRNIVLTFECTAREKSSYERTAAIIGESLKSMAVTYVTSFQ